MPIKFVTAEVRSQKINLYVHSTNFHHVETQFLTITKCLICKFNIYLLLHLCRHSANIIQLWSPRKRIEEKCRLYVACVREIS